MYEHMDELLDDILSRIQSEPDLEFGLLTNGLYLSDSIAEKAARAFSYVRLSYAEAFGNPEGEELEDRFIGNLAGFLNGLRTQAARPNVGLKLLLSHQNADQLVAKLCDIRRRLEKKGCFGRLNHIRIKAMRSARNGVEPTEEDSLKFRNEFYEKIFDPDGWPDDIQIDLDLRRVDPESFRCRLNPLIAVVDPNGYLMACCNYVEAYEQLKIGDLDVQRLKDVWGSEHHRDVTRSIDAETVCNSAEGAPCRMVEYCEILSGDHFERQVWRPRAPRRGL
jgi:radical SAM protein with 4Fe4S-binding SPASM domain